MNTSITNPLLEAPGLASIQFWLSNTAELVRRLMDSPIPQAGECILEKKSRRLLIEDYQRIFVPTRQAIRIADRMLSVIFQDLDKRNPTWPNVQRWINSTQQWHGRRIDDIPWNPTQAKGMIIEGITGIGKSHIVDRVLGLLPQVVDHTPGGDWGMLKLRQLVWLKVPMPADHTRSGLLVSILAELDRVLDTDYSVALLRSSKRIEALIVGVMQLLVQHRCGMLVIEEAQVENLGSLVFSRDFLNYFLRILNWGVPILIIGNPLAFRELRKHAQDVDRFSEGGWFTLLPEQGPESETWRRSWIPGLWNPSLLDSPDAEYTPLVDYPEVRDWPAFLWQLTGGMPRHLARLRAEVMDQSLVNGGVVVTSEFVHKVFSQSPKFANVRSRNRALANHDVKALMAYRDLPIEQLRDYWLLDKLRKPERQSTLPFERQESLKADVATDERKKLSNGLKAVTQDAVAVHLSMKSANAKI